MGQRLLGPFFCEGLSDPLTPLFPELGRFLSSLEDILDLLILRPDLAQLQLQLIPLFTRRLCLIRPLQFFQPSL